MTDLRDAARQALNSLRGYRREISCEQPCDAERALEAALEQPEHPPMRAPKENDRVICIEDESLGTVWWTDAAGGPYIKFDDGSYGQWMLHEFGKLFRYAALEQQEQEPVAWLESPYGSIRANTTMRFQFPPQSLKWKIPLYTHPPRREWRGLTDTERAAVQYESFKRGLSPLEFMELHEAKLKERNA
jgi:hypothetical protein